MTIYKLYALPSWSQSICVLLVFELIKTIIPHASDHISFSRGRERERDGWNGNFSWDHTCKYIPINKYHEDFCDNFTITYLFLYQMNEERKQSEFVFRTSFSNHINQLIHIDHYKYQSIVNRNLYYYYFFHKCLLDCVNKKVTNKENRRRWKKLQAKVEICEKSQ